MKIDFLKSFDSYSDAQLIEMLCNESGFQAAAIQAAYEILRNRKHSDEEIEQAKGKLIEKNMELILQDKNLTDHPKTDDDPNIGDVVHEPVVSEASKKLVILISVSWFAFFAFHLYTLSPLMIRLVNGNEKLNLLNIQYIILLGLVPVSIFYFLKKNKIGWILLCTLATFSLIGAVSALIVLLDIYAISVDTYGLAYALTPVIENVMSQLIYLGTICILWLSKIRTIYQIDLRTMFIVILATSILKFAMIWKIL